MSKENWKTVFTGLGATAGVLLVPWLYNNFPGMERAFRSIAWNEPVGCADSSSKVGAILVFGAGFDLNNQQIQPSLPGTNRLREAVMALRSKISDKIMLAGDINGLETDTTMGMKILMNEYAVPQEAIIVAQPIQEYLSTTTDVLDARLEASRRNIGQVVIANDPYDPGDNAERAVARLCNLGLQASPLNMRRVPRNGNEILGMLETAIDKDGSLSILRKKIEKRQQNGFTLK